MVARQSNFALYRAQPESRAIARLPVSLALDDGRGFALDIDENKSPYIDHISWGRMEVAGIGVGKDFKLWPGGGREWDWRETNTHHVPGIQPADIQELLDHGSQTVVLSRGMLLMLRTCQETLAMLEKRQIVVHVAETKAAARIYNGSAASGEAVGGLFHSTCRGRRARR